MMKTRSYVLTVIAAISAFALFATSAEAGGRRKYYRHGWNYGGYGYYQRGWGNCGYGYYRPYYRPVYYYPAPYYYRRVYYRPAPAFFVQFGFY